MMSRTSLPLLAAALLLLPLAPQPAVAAEAIDLDALTRIRDEGLHRSQVMATVRHLTDEIGPRLTGSPQAKQASEWTRDQLKEWGLANAHLEPFDFGRGWSWNAVSANIVAPQPIPLIALPKAYTPGTDGPVRGPLMAVTVATEKDFEQYRGKLAGKILLLDEAHDFAKDLETPAAARRYTPETLEELGQLPIPKETDNDREKRYVERIKMRRARNDFFTQEKVLATIEASGAPWGILRVGSGGSYKPGETTGPPALVISAEQYNRLLRMVGEDQKKEKDEKVGKDEKNQKDAAPAVEAEIDVRARYYDDDHNSYNTIAEIPGSDRNGEIVMVGAHLDSWHGATGATDNAAGSAIVMEAMRILKAAGIKPRRTIRIALWTGEEQGLKGSTAYVAEHFGARPEPEDPEQKELPPSFRKPTGPFKPKPEHARLSAYFNVDNGGGKIRGIYAEESSAAAAVFEDWLRPLRDLGAGTVTLRHTGSTDHVPFLDAGLPGFQFIQDELDYMEMTHHTNMDSYDHLEREDLTQAAVVLASFLYDAAMRPEKMPRKPMPAD
jgi:hypothetical protein